MTAVALEPSESHDATRWVTLAVTIMSAFIVVLDNTVLNVSIPTILRDLHTTLPSLQWVVTGYALTFATFLIIGGRLGDIYGHRRVFIVGAGLFGVGSLLASVATSVPQLVLGEAIIEGIGASLMLPATLAILSVTFQGRERATAFAAWGATAGVAAACGPLVGGFLTTDYSWRWSFRINVIIAPLAMVGAILFMKKAGAPPERRPRIDVIGAAMVAVGMFLFVFALSEGGLYGWWKPIEPFTIAGHTIWPTSMPVAITPIALVVGLVILYAFWVFERAKERRNDDPLFEIAHFRYRTYRWGLITSTIVAMGQLGLSFVLPVFLQQSRHLSAEQNGLWQLPTGIFIIIGAQAGARLARRIGTTQLVRIGLFAYTVGIVLILKVTNLGITWYALLPGLAFYGVGIGFAGAQLTNVVLSEIPKESSGVASGTNTTMRQVGAALGVAVIGSVLAAQTVHQATTRIRASAMTAATKVQAIAGVHAMSTAYQPSANTPSHDVSTLVHITEISVASSTRYALVFAIVVVGIGSFLSFLIPTVPTFGGRAEAEVLEPVEPMDIDPAALAPSHP
ncbi:MAG TPA: MFS transporter [Acidimicrobiia bacterium]